MRKTILALATLVSLAACKSQPRISAQLMERNLGKALFEFNRALNAGYGDQARLYVAPEATADYDKMLAGGREKRYNFFFADEAPKIDYLAGEADVREHLFWGSYTTDPTPKPNAKEVEVQIHKWKFDEGAWRWHGQALH